MSTVGPCFSVSKEPSQRGVEMTELARTVTPFGRDTTSKTSEASHRQLDLSPGLTQPGKAQLGAHKCTDP